MHDIAQMLMMAAGSRVVARTVGGSSAQEGIGAAAYTTAALSAGAAAPDRLLVVAVTCSAGGARTTTGMTIGGVSATLLARSTYGAATETTLWAAVVPDGTTAVVSATTDAAITAYALSLIALYGAKPTPHYTVTGNPFSGDTGAITGVPNGVVIAATQQESSDFNTSVVSVDASVTSTPLGSSTVSCAAAFPKTSGNVGPLTSGTGGATYVAASFSPA